MSNTMPLIYTREPRVYVFDPETVQDVVQRDGWREIGTVVSVQITYVTDDGDQARA